MSTRLRFLFLASLTASLSCVASARSANKNIAGIYGSVIAKSTAPTEDFGTWWALPYCEITIVSQRDKKVIKKLPTNRYGKFTLNLPPGNYIVVPSIPTANKDDGWTPQDIHVTVWQGYRSEASVWIDAF